ncbi:Bis-ABC ATPase YheS [hydrothermal vent metagenome]|uniref:Bis-ABC ATPase YheS n=1 Tax=hydrothermal vent metagenome TaxID=652676 RepID=A0A3B1AA06_9ZZZZ
MLNFTNLALRRGAKVLLQNVTTTFQKPQKVGITGANGAGKSSLFALIRNELHVDEGDFYIQPKITIAHVAQETPAVNVAAIEYVKDGDTELRSIEQKIEFAEKNENGTELAQLYSDMEHIDGYTANSRAGRLLHGLGFSAEQEQVSVSEFSGGWRMRLNLAQALMCRSDLLLLDEPTNHLDLETVIWLEDWLRSYPGLLLLISHDRDFLDSVVSHIAHIEQGELKVYTGNYSEFEIRRAEQLATQQAAYEKQQKEIVHMQSFVDRFRAKATKAKQAQSRVKALERMTIISQAHIDSPFFFHFKKSENIPSPILSLDDCSVGYSDTMILSKINLIASEGDRIGLLGHNGAGKSTLIKLLAGELTAQQGLRIPAKEINVGYFAQHQLEQLDDHASPILHLQRIDPKATEKQLRQYLGGFAFRNDMATSTIAHFSGGEKARLVLAILVYQKPNLLLLDEPTNHLDLEMRYALTTALQEFEGAMLIVSHDRHLLRTVTDKLLLVADGKVEDFDGDLDDYRQWVKDQDRDITDSRVYDKDASAENNTTKKQVRQSAAEQRQKTKPLRNKIKKFETEIDKLTKLKENFDTALAESAIYEDDNKENLKKILAEQIENTKKLNDIEEQWFEANDELESLTSI